VQHLRPGPPHLASAVASTVAGVGTNRRYGSDVTYRAVAAAVLRAEPVSLTRSQVGDSVTQATRDNHVIASVPFRVEQTVEIEARVIAWTDRAVCVEFQTKDGQTRQAWVWAGAVRRP
jgi:hypothetical protein